MTAELSDEDFLYLDGLPMTLQSSVAPELLLTHGTPRSHSEGLGPWTSAAKLEKIIQRLPESVLVCAHTHRQMYRRCPSGRVVNVGSVGLPFDSDTRAQYALFDWDGRKWTIDLRRVEYNLEEIFAVYDSTGFSPDGGVSSELLPHELTHAAPFLVPFLKWTEALGVEPTSDRIGGFLDLYDPGEPVHEFFIRLDATVRDRFGKSG
jgi:diadenosine tetraphosphatase ApaH/serine/threonine PP2A family protein phosphatase